jgi:zinc finger HIT domain-containing protein 1
MTRVGVERLAQYFHPVHLMLTPPPRTLKMNNFGVVELASTKTTNAPGWAYVPDTAINPAAAIQPTNRKRAARNQGNLSSSDASARQDAKIRRELEALNRDNQKDVNIPIPPKTGAGRGT